MMTLEIINIDIYNCFQEFIFGKKLSGENMKSNNFSLTGAFTLAAIPPTNILFGITVPYFGADGDEGDGDTSPEEVCNTNFNTITVFAN